MNVTHQIINFVNFNARVMLQEMRRMSVVMSFAYSFEIKMKFQVC